MTRSTSERQPGPQMLSRRRLLQAGGIGALSMGLPGMVGAQVAGDRGLGKGAAEKSVIFVLLCGGPSHIDTWDLKPEAPAEIRGPYQPIDTKVPGMRISELNTRLSTLTDKFALVRSMTHVGNISNHFDAMHHLLSGQADSPLDAPYIGAILAKVRPTQRTVAPYVWLIKCVGDPVFCAPNIGTAGHLGMAYSPMFVGSALNHPAMPTFTPPEELLPAVPAERMLVRRQLLDGLDPSATGNVSGGSEARKDWQDLYGRAFELASGTEARIPYELDREPTEVRERYGMHPLGQNLLLARRLVEAGVGFVTVNGWTGVSPTGGGGAPSSSWDMHGGEMGMGSAFGDGSYGMGYCLPRLDEGLSALLTDLDDRGLLDTTMVVVMGEFGRTPRINQPGTNPGRQHWPACYSAILAGGGIRGGQVYGETDKTGSYVKDNPVRSQDLGATIYHSLGVPLELRLGKDGFTRPISSGEPLLRLFG